MNGDTFRTPGNSERRERRVRGAVNGAERPFRKFWAFCFVHWQVVWCGSPALRLFSNYVVLHTKLPARRCCEPAAATSGAQAAGERVRLAALLMNHPVRYNYLGARSLSTTPPVNWRQGPMMRRIERMVHDLSRKAKKRFASTANCTKKRSSTLRQAPRYAQTELRAS